MILSVFGFSLFLSAAAMFALQPMAGKMLLPLVGGTPAGWIAAMAFFQVMLLAGYLLAHLFSRFTPRGHALLYILALGAGAAFLPVSLADFAGVMRGTPGPADVFILLTVTVAAPFIALACTSSTLQRLFMTTGHAAAEDPYFLYAASNLGSFGGLLLYPLLIEPNLSLTDQAQYWQYAYLALMACAAACLAAAGKGRAPSGAKDAAPPVSWRLRGTWVMLAFFPCCLLMGVTTFITTDIFSVPMIWVLPLGLYLLTFVAAFSRRPPVSLRLLEILAPYAVMALVMLLLARHGWLTATILNLPALLLIFTVVALYCHMRLVALRPLRHDRQLTEFYLFLSVGGALGGVVSAFVIPVVLERAIEFPLMLTLALVLHPDIGGYRTKAGRALIALVALAFALTLFPLPSFLPGVSGVHYGLMVAMVGLMLAPPRRMVLGALLIFMVSEFVLFQGDTLVQKRNFFGVIKVWEEQSTVDGKNLTVRKMTHGTTLHGFQMLGGGYDTVPTTYFSRKGPLGGLFDVLQPKNVGVIGLGTGTINCYAAPDRRFTFFEIDPDVIATAQEHFTFLSACKSAAPPRLILGDGRLELEKLGDERFDLFILDAFSSDVVPTHLLTGEALALYFQRVKPDGIVVLHVSNRYFLLHPAIAATADGLGLQSRFMLGARENLEPYGSESIWVVLARPGVDIDRLGWPEITRRPGLKPWTDDYTNLLSTLAYFQ